MLSLALLLTGIGAVAFAESAEPKTDSPRKIPEEQASANARYDIRGGYTGALPKKIPSAGNTKAAPSADRAVPRTATPLGLEVVDQAVSDRGPLDVSLRQRESGLGLPTGFRTVYRLPGEESGFGVGDRTSERLMRADGGIAAVFDQSIYLQTEQGILPDVPASTTWVIGGIPLASEPGHGMLLPVDPLNIGRLPQFRRNISPPAPNRVAGERAGFRVGTRISSEDRLDSSGRTEKKLPKGSGCRFLDDRTYRAARLQSLLDSTRRRLDEELISPAGG